MKHTSKVVQSLEKVREIMNLADANFEATAEQYRALTRMQVNSKDLEKYVKTIMGVSEYEMRTTDKGSEILAAVIPLFQKGRGNDIASIKGSMWAAYNAFNEYLGYQRGDSSDRRLDNLWFGQGANLNKRALEVALEMTKAA